MTAANVACPRCRTVLQVPPLPGPGQLLKCPRCGSPFSISAPAPVRSAAPAAPARAARPARAPAPPEEDEPDFPEPATLGTRRQTGGKGGVIIVGLLIAALVLGGVGLFIDRVVFSPARNPVNEPEAPGQGSQARNEGRVRQPNPVNFHNALPREKQHRVNEAIDRAVRYLRGRQLPDGRWEFAARSAQADQDLGAHPVGLAALPGLTLLEYGVPGQDPAVARAADFVRRHSAGLNQTYDISLAILFLDRLGEPGDRELIRTLALRLVAGQTGNGGWTYTCPVRPPGEDRRLVAVLGALPPPSKLALVDSPRRPDPHNQLDLKEPPPADPTVDRTKLVLDAPRPSKSKLALIDQLPGSLRQVPALKVEPSKRRAPEKSDNSNTQFACLALWAARRYDLPLDRTLALVVKRFRTSQFANGAWAYGYAYTVGVPPGEQAKRRWVGRDTMTCAGLLGLALGHGLAADLKTPGPLSGRDPAVEKGLKVLGKVIGRPARRDKASGEARYSLYLLWSVERVGVIYNIKKIGRVDWYAWGTDLLLKNQNADGSWSGYDYHGSCPTVDTCLALLFLKRVNLTRGLPEKLTLRLPEGDR